jgi:hypothetical protein
MSLEEHLEGCQCAVLAAAARECCAAGAFGVRRQGWVSQQLEVLCSRCPGIRGGRAECWCAASSVLAAAGSRWAPVKRGAAPYGILVLKDLTPDEPGARHTCCNSNC